MKTLKLKTLTLAALLTFGFLTGTAGNPNKADTGLVRQKIQHGVSLPEELKQPGFNQKVKVSFVLDKSGNVKEVAASTADKALKKTLESQFKQMVLNELQAGTYNVEINFNVY